MKLSTGVAMAIGAIIAGIGVAGVVAPSVLLEFGRSLLTPAGLYAVAAVRIVLGALLFWAAPASRMPKVVRAIGAVIVVAGVLTPLFGVERSQAVFAWWASQDASWVRAIAVVAIAFGAFLFHVFGRSQHPRTGT